MFFVIFKRMWPWLWNAEFLTPRRAVGGASSVSSSLFGKSGFATLQKPKWKIHSLGVITWKQYLNLLQIIRVYKNCSYNTRHTLLCCTTISRTIVSILVRGLRWIASLIFFSTAGLQDIRSRPQWGLILKDPALHNLRCNWANSPWCVCVCLKIFIDSNRLLLPHFHYLLLTMYACLPFPHCFTSLSYIKYVFIRKDHESLMRKPVIARQTHQQLS